MLKIRTILQNKRRGKSDRVTARVAGLSRNTLKCYLDRLRASGWDFGELLRLDDGKLWELAKPSAGVPAGDADPRVSELLAYLDNALPDLGKKGVTRQQLWAEYRL